MIVGVYTVKERTTTTSTLTINRKGSKTTVEMLNKVEKI